jgi:hypothetical protein
MKDEGKTIKFTEEELERMYVSYMKRTYEGRMVDFGAHIKHFDEFKKEMLESKFIKFTI